MATLSGAPSFLGYHTKYDPVVDKEKFEKELNEVFNKILQTAEAPAKEKHIRSVVIATWREEGCATPWKVIKKFPLSQSPVVCWKACYCLHKMLRDGYPQNVKKSANQAKFVSELAKHWNQLGDGYSRMITSYLKVLWNKIAFHVKNNTVPSNFKFDKPFVVPSDIDHAFQMTVEVFDYQSALLHMYAAILANIDPGLGKVSNNQMQCRIVPFVPAIGDSASLYDIVYKLMKALHTSLPADTLQGHRERFERQYHALRKYFLEANKMAYIKKFVEIPVLPPDPPNFLIGSYINDVVLSEQLVMHDPEDSLSSSRRESQVMTDEVIVDFDGPETTNEPPAPPPRRDSSTKFDNAFGAGGFEPFFVSEETKPAEPQRDDRDLLIEQLMREIVELKERIRELEEQNEANLELLASLREQMEAREAELRDCKEMVEQTNTENALLKQQVEAHAQGDSAQTEALARADAAEKKFSQLREVYQKLRNEHIQLLRGSGESQKKLNKAEKDLMAEEEKRMDLEKSITSLKVDFEKAKQQASDESAQLTLLRDTLKAKEKESSQLLQSTSSLKEQLQKAETSSSHTYLVQSLENAEAIIKHAVHEVEEQSTAGMACTPDFLKLRTQNALETLNTFTTSFTTYANDSSAMGGALATLSSFAQSMSDVIICGGATGHNASAEMAEKFNAKSKSVGDNSLKLLHLLKQERLSPQVLGAYSNELQKSITQLTQEAEDLIALNALVADEGTLGDIVEEEMASTTRAIDEAAQKIEEMLLRSREEHTGVNLEVNERVLDSCTELMKYIQQLIQRSRDLQKEIVSEGMGSMHDAKDFYNKNNTWSEGLISAAKQVGFGASLLVDAADKAVTGAGKFEELIVTSRGIAASTAQLVAASKVKARARSEKLKSLKSSSRQVSEATGTVVASAQSGAEIKADAAAKANFSNLTLNQAKRLEMESQVRALELEKELEMERKKLAELRKIHYHIAGASEGWDEENT